MTLSACFCLKCVSVMTAIPRHQCSSSPLPDDLLRQASTAPRRSGHIKYVKYMSSRNQHSVTVSDVVSWQVKIGLHQFDNYLSQVKINVKTVNNSHRPTQDIWRVNSSFSRTVASCITEIWPFEFCEISTIGEV